jgi:hypothetical protein
MARSAICTEAAPGMQARRFRDRSDAGRALAAKLAGYADRPDVLVLALPRGGVPVAYEVAGALGAPLDVFLVRKLGVPGHEELAMGAVATGVRVLNEAVVTGLGVPPYVIDAVTAWEQQELARRESRLVAVPAGPVVLEGDLRLPAGARGIVLFAHGSGSSRHSPRNWRVAARLNEAALATLLVDLLTREEDMIDRQTVSTSACSRGG